MSIKHNWRETNGAEVLATTNQPGNDLESAIVTALPAAGEPYTAITCGVNDTSGVAIVEIYALN